MMTPMAISPGEMESWRALTIRASRSSGRELDADGGGVMLQSSPAGATALFSPSALQCKCDGRTSAQQWFREIEKTPNVESRFALYRRRNERATPSQGAAFADADSGRARRIAA